VWAALVITLMILGLLIALFFAMDAVLIALQLVGYRDEFWFIWISPVLIVSYLSFRRLHGLQILMGEA
jgi:hypothetical protein